RRRGQDRLRRQRHGRPLDAEGRCQDGRHLRHPGQPPPRSAHRRFRQGVTSRVMNRRRYLVIGLSLAVTKYAGDVLLVWLGTRAFWSVASYVRSVYFLWNAVWTHAPVWLLPALTLWTLPFLAVGVILTIRRAEDAGLSPWIGLGFLVPYVNYFVMAALC